ncbi:uncharacterized protein [Panulirus ornatus]|uniref:uncharacterized protein isoform X2 n=1 Tax=Panulirus ornatus TaxID=150431 RepID=UPI003A89DA1E
MEELRKMAETEPINSDMVTRSVNFHGHQLLKELTAAYPREVEGLNLKDVDYKVYKARVPEVMKQSNYRRHELLNFITNKCMSLFLPREVNPLAEEGEDDYGTKNRRDHLPPLEYFLKADPHIRENMFFKTVKRGDILFVRVVTYVRKVLHLVKVYATMGSSVRDLSCTDIKAHLRIEDTEPTPADKDDHGRWLMRTRLCVEVLAVDASDKYLLVGTNGVTLEPHLKDVIKLGKVTLNDRPPIISAMEEQSIQSYAQTLEELTAFKNPRSIRHLASKFDIDLFSHSSLMETLKYKFADQEMYQSLWKSQMSRWAHKSVADGVVFFKQGRHEEAFQHLNKALQIDPENVEAFVAKGALLANLGRFEKAVEDFEQALKYNPSHSNARKYMCETLVELGRQLEEDRKLEEAEKKYKKCLEINPKHTAGLEAMNALDRNDKCITSDPKSSPQSNSEVHSSVSQSRGRSKSSNQSRSRSRSISLSPLSQKMALQEGKWQPPSSINTSSSFMNTAVPPTIGVAPVGQSYAYPMTGWPPTTAAAMVTDAQVPISALYTQPPPGYPTLPAPGIVTNSSYTSREDEEYKARVYKFLKDLEGFRPSHKKDRGKKSHTRERESRKRRKHNRDSHKRRSRSKKSSSRSRSSSSYSSTSRSSSSTSSSSSSSESSDHSGRKKYKKRKKYEKNEKKDKKVSKVDRSQKRAKTDEKLIHKTSTKIEEDPIPELESLNEKLSAYYKKVEASKREPQAKEKKTGENDPSESKGILEESDCITEMVNVLKKYEQGFRLPSKNEVASNSASSIKVHPTFRESDEEDILDQPASSCLNEESPMNANKDFGSSTRNGSETIAKGHAMLGSRDCSETLGDHSRSHSRGHSKSHPRGYSESSSKGHSDSVSRIRSGSDCRGHLRSRSRGHSRSRSKSRTQSYSRGRSREKANNSNQRWNSSFDRSQSRTRYQHHSQGQGQCKWQKGGNFREERKEEFWYRRCSYKGSTSPKPLDRHEREMMIEAAKQNLEAQIKYGTSDPTVLENKWESHHWETSQSKTPGHWEYSRQKTPSRWNSSHPRTPSRWDSSRPKTPSRWDSSRPKTPSKWDSPRPKTPSRWKPLHPRTPSRWESSHPKTPSRWESSLPKTPSRWDSSHPKTPSRWESSRPKTPSRWESSRPKTPSRWDSPHSRSQTCMEDDKSFRKASPDSHVRFGRWDKEESCRNGEPKIGNSLREMESFVEAAKQKKMEEMKERNKEFLKPIID